VFLGFNSGGYNGTGCNNVFLGGYAGARNTCGSFNVIVGQGTGQQVSSGIRNVLLGTYAGMNQTTSENNILIGYNTGATCITSIGICGLVNLTTDSNRIIMGNSAHTCAQIQIAWTAVSDARDKCIYGAVNKGLGFLKDVNPIEFAFKDRTTNELIGDGKKRYGFSAQEILSLEGDKPVIVSNDNPDKLFLTNDYLVPVLVNAIKELSVEIETLKNNTIKDLNTKIDTLENKVKDLENK
jgi:hypothetical protein